MSNAPAHLPKASCTDAGGIVDKSVSNQSDCNIWQLLHRNKSGRQHPIPALCCTRVVCNTKQLLYLTELDGHR